MVFQSFRNATKLNGSNSDHKPNHFVEFRGKVSLGSCSSCDLVIPQLGHCVKLVPQPAAAPVGLYHIRSCIRTGFQTSDGSEPRLVGGSLRPILQSTNREQWKILCPSCSPSVHTINHPNYYHITNHTNGTSF